jgi:hypothetical protein
MQPGFLVSPSTDGAGLCSTVRRSLPALAVALCLSACIPFSRTGPYPTGWPPLAAVEQGRCPTIAGKYFNHGIVSGEISCVERQTRSKAEWNCDPDLSENLAHLRGGDWVELRQPDNDTLLVIVPDNPTPKVLKKSRGDFGCDKAGLTKSAAGSVYSEEGRSDLANAGVTFLGVMTLSAGITSSALTFRPAQDGSLVMEVEDSLAMYDVLFAVVGTVNGFVRWEPYRVPQPSAEDSPTVSSETGSARANPRQRNATSPKADPAGD